MSLENLEKAIKHMKDNWEKRGGGRLADQNSFNIVLKNEDIKLAILDLKDYPNGSRYFNNINSIYKNYTPKIVHNNYIVGTKNKIERFKKNGLWFIK